MLLSVAAITFTEEFNCSTPRERMFKVLALDQRALISQAIKGIQLIEGDGGPGSIKQMNFTEC